jgi:predicted nucleic acid-binding protein
VKTGSPRRRSTLRRPAWAARDLPGPLYLDTSALAKLYFPEADSEAMDRALRGRRDLTVSDLAVTELVSALARRRREQRLRADVAAQLSAAMLADLESGMFRRVDLAPAAHRAAERLLLSVPVPLRVADALHLALAMTAGVAAIVTFDRRLAEAARSLGLSALP